MVKTGDTAAGPQSRRFYALDALRGVAAVQVVVGHMFGFPRQLASNFVLAVDFFFCLSGFVIAYAYEQRLLQGMRMREFVTIRLIRLYPLYILGTVIGIVEVLKDPAFSVALHWQHGHFLRAVLPALVMLPSRASYMTVSSYPFDGPAWSLFAEVIVNFAYAMVVLRFKVSNWALAGTALVALLVLVFLPADSQTLATGADWGTMRDGIARAFLSFPIGVLLYRVHRAAGPARWFSGALSVDALGLLTLMFLLCVYWSIPALRNRAGQLCIVTVVFPAMVWVGSRLRIPPTLTAFCALAGDISYPLYILHFPFVGLLEEGGAIAAMPPGRLHYLLPVACIFVFVLLAWGAARLYDAPVRSLLRRRLGRSKRRSEPPVGHFATVKL
jgi:peptidoglycan/LPS O-acetylase OafA/YrhL